MPTPPQKPRTTQIPIKPVLVFGQDLPPENLDKSITNSAPTLQQTASEQPTSQPTSPQQTTPQPTKSENFTLNMQPANTAAETAKTKPSPKPGNLAGAKPLIPQEKLKGKSPSSAKAKLKIWSWLEWLATSAAIFVLLFFVLNWSSYSMLLKSKLDQIKGGVQNNPYYEQLTKTTHSAATTEQTPLPIAANSEVAKKQIPEINMAIIPPDDRIIIPNINKNVPIVRVSSEKLISKDWAGLEKEIQDALQEGVVHYPTTAQPGDKGNVVITGHSSYFPWDPGRWKDVFALLHQVKIGDEVVVYHDQKKYVYKVYDKFEVTPDRIDVLTQKGEDRLTLITCTPVGTNLRRLIVLAKPIEME